MKTYLEIRDLWKKFGDFVALRDISLDVYDGEFICFLGPSGCGKTTLLRAIAGLDIQTSGSVFQDGKDVSDLPASGRDFGIVFQSYALFPNLTVTDNIAFGLQNIGTEKAATAARVKELLELVGLPDQADKYPAKLSGGQQQRIALARAIASSPGLLLLDEPLSALDAKVRVHLRHEMKELQRKLNVTTVMVTHDQEEALSMADRIVVMNHGVIEQVGTPTEIYTAPSTLFVADFIGEMNKMDGVIAGPGQVKIGDRTLLCETHDFAVGQAVIVAIRPENAVPHAESNDGAENTFDVVVEDMEFLGSFWRTNVSNESLRGASLVVDLSINALRRLGVTHKSTLSIELPPSAIRIYDANTGSGK